jgi:multiple sugar transport system substrate-binding protein
MLALLFVAALTACHSAPDPELSDQRRTLRVGLPYGGMTDESGLREELTDAFEITHPDIGIELAFAADPAEPSGEPDPMVKLKSLLTGPRPADVVVFDLNQLPALAQDRLLLPLDSMMKESGMKPEDFVPAVIETIREHGDGRRLYALSPTFNASALFYNKALFTRQNVAPPTDGMTWEDALILARRLASGSGPEAVYGITFSLWGSADPFADMDTYAAPLRLRMFDDEAERMTVKSSGWEEVWSTFRSLYADGVLPTAEAGVTEGGLTGVHRNRPFFAGKAAMTVGNFSLIQELNEFNRVADRLGMEPVDWGVVPLPVHPQKPDTGLMSIGRLMGINAGASNPEDAWAFIRFHHGEARAKQLARNPSVMSTLQFANKAPDGFGYDPAVFYRLKAGTGLTESESRLYRERPNLHLVRRLGGMIFRRVISGELTVAEGLDEWERSGNELLSSIRQNPDGFLLLDGDGRLPETGSGGFILPPADGVDEGQFSEQP